MQLYNSLTGTLEWFRPAGEVKLYTCGITPYDTTHLGHAFTYIVSDILVHYLESSGLRVTYVQNVTDIDDDILLKAREAGQVGPWPAGAPVHPRPGNGSGYPRSLRGGRETGCRDFGRFEIEKGSQGRPEVAARLL